MNQTSILNFPFSISHFFPLKIRFNLRLFWILFSVLIIILLVFYIFQVNNLTSQNNQIQNFQRKIKELSLENERLKIKLAHLASLVNIETLIKEFNFERVDKIHYIQISDTQIVNPVRKGGELGSYPF